jgi:hypothetical protein
MVKTDVVISRSECKIGGNVFHLISTAYLALERNGKLDIAKEMREKINAEAESPDDVLKIVKEYVILR